MMAGFDLHSVCARCRDKKKGQDACVEKPGSDSLHCNALTSEQLAQLSTPSYNLKKEKCELKSSTPAKNPPSPDNTLSPTLVDPALVSVVGVVDGQSTSGSPGLSEQPAEKKKEDKKATSSKSVKPTSHRPASSVSTDQKIEVLDKNWSVGGSVAGKNYGPTSGAHLQCCQGHTDPCSTGQCYQE